MHSKLYSFLALLSASLPVGATGASGSPPLTSNVPTFFNVNSPTVPIPLTGDQSFDFLLYGSLELANGGGAGTADILNAAHYIKPLDMEGFANTFWALANQTLAAAKAVDGPSRAAGITARESYFAAATYFRNADFYLHKDPKDPRLAQLWASQTAAFSAGLSKLTDFSAKPFNLTTKYNFTIPGFYYSIDDKPRPTVLITTGYDGPQEEFLFWLGPQILQQGWNFATYEGPGQPTVIHEQGIGFRPDWEVVTSPVIDWLEKEPTADLTQLTSVGMSLGGILAARAAAFEPRIKALVLNGGIYSLYQAFALDYKQLLPLLNSNPKRFDALIYKYIINNATAPTNERWGVEQGLYTFATRSPANLLQQSKGYNVSSYVQQIKCPTWIVNATQDYFFPGQPIEMYNALKKTNSKVTLQSFGGVGGLHDQIGAALELNRAMWTWINGIWPNAVPS